jgi:hypothetical protein
MTVECEICGKEFKTTQGLRGHKTFVHGITKDKSDSVTEPATEREPGELTNKLVNTGMGGHPTSSGRTQNHPGGISPLSGENVSESTEQLGQYTELLRKVTEELKLLQMGQEMLDNRLEEQDSKIENLHEEVGNIRDNSNSAVEQYTELANCKLSRMQAEIDTLRSQSDEQGQSIKQLEDLTQADLVLEKKYGGQLNLVFERLSSFERELSIVSNNTIRQPTGELLSDSLIGQGNHRYKAYRTPDGLAQPYRYSQDPILGDRWIDLNEPEG